MKKRFLALAIVLAIIAAMIVPMAVSAASVQVGPGKTYTDIQSGITAAGASGTVTVFPGTYTITSPIVVPNGVTMTGPMLVSILIPVPEGQRPSLLQP